jgi:hypothetical protein
MPNFVNFAINGDPPVLGVQMSAIDRVVKATEDVVGSSAGSRLAEEATAALQAAKGIMAPSTTGLESAARGFHQGVETITNSPFVAFSGDHYKYVPVRELISDIRTAQGPIMRDIYGPSQIVFGDNDRVQHILHSRASTMEQREDLMLTAGFANLIHADVLARDAASKVKGMSAGFIPHEIERFASPEQMHQNAITGAEAYVSRDASRANRYTAYLTERFGEHTPDEQQWGRTIVSGRGGAADAWNPVIGPSPLVGENF